MAPRTPHPTPEPPAAPCVEPLPEQKDHERVLVRVVGSISRACIMYGAKSVERLGLNVSQGAVLGEVFRNHGCSQDELRMRVKLNKGNITRALQHLEERGLVTRNQDSADRRVVRVFATPKARAMEHELYAIASLWDDALTLGFTPDERETLTSLLLRMETNADAMARRDVSSESERLYHA